MKKHLFELLLLLFSVAIPFALDMNLAVYGMLATFLLFLALQFKLLRLRHISMVGNFLLANMTILFLPPAVGIMDKFQVIAPYLLPIILIVLGAIVLNVCVIAVVVQLIKTRFEGDYEEGDASNV